MVWPFSLNMNINEDVQPPVDCEMATQYSAIVFVNLGEYCKFGNFSENFILVNSVKRHICNIKNS